MTELFNTRNSLFRTLTQTPHREYGPILSQYRELLIQDPLFVSKALVHITRVSSINDLVDAAIGALLCSPAEYSEFRQAGRALAGLDCYVTRNTDGIRALPPFRFIRLISNLHTHPNKPSRQLTELVHDWVTVKEQNTRSWDNIIELNRHELKWLIRSFHVPISVRTNDILFRNRPPEGTKFWEIKQLPKINDITERGRRIMAINEEYGLSFKTASSFLPKGDPISAIVELELMTPNEVGNAAKRFEESGVLNNPEVMKIFAEKITQARSAASLTNRKSSQVQSEAVKAVVLEAADKAASRGQKIQNRILLLVDISQSMDDAVPTSIAFLSHIVPRIENPEENLKVVLFNTYAYELKFPDYNMSTIQRQLGMVRADGSTQMHKALAKGTENFYPDNVVMITDGGEYPYPGSFARDFQFYIQARQQEIGLALIMIGRNKRPGFPQSLETNGITVDSFDYSGDYIVFDNITGLLSTRRHSIVDDILEIELPEIVRRR